MDNLLAATGPTGDWAAYFTNDLDAARARYQAARDTFQQVLSESPSDSQSLAESLFTSTEAPAIFTDGQVYDLGTRFRADLDGSIVAVRLYVGAVEQGVHTVRIWDAASATVVAGPFDWTLSPTSDGWQTFTLPTSLPVTAGADYIVSATTAPDAHYAAENGAFASGIVNGHLHAYPSAGVYTSDLGTMPANTYQDTNYLRDVVFIPTIP